MVGRRDQPTMREVAFRPEAINHPPRTHDHLRVPHPIPAFFRHQTSSPRCSVSDKISRHPDSDPRSPCVRQSRLRWLYRRLRQPPGHSQIDSLSSVHAAVEQIVHPDPSWRTNGANLAIRSPGDVLPGRPASHDQWQSQSSPPHIVGWFPGFLP